MSDIQDRLDAYKAAELKVLRGQSVDIEGRRLTRADLAEIRRGIRELEAKLARTEAPSSFIKLADFT